jgi:RNA polymerase sigma factor (sigma-70 family)
MTSSFAPFESETHYRALRTKLVTFFNYRRCSDPEDLADETVTRIVTSYSRGTTPTDVNRWGYGIARRVYLEWLRDPQRQSEPLNGAEEDAPLSPNAEKFRMVAQVLIGSLDSQNRDLLEERYIDDVGYETLARRRGISAGGMRARVCRLRRDLSHRFTSVMR